MRRWRVFVSGGYIFYRLIARRDVRLSGGHFFSLSGKGDLAGIAGQPPLKMRHRRIFFTLRPQTPKEKSLVLTWAQFPFSVGDLLSVDKGKSTGASVRPVVPLAPLGR